MYCAMYCERTVLCRACFSLSVPFFLVIHTDLYLCMRPERWIVV